MRKWTLLLLGLLLAFAGGVAAAQEEAGVYNGDFAIAEAALPDGWVLDAWDMEASEARTVLSPTGARYVVVENHVENDARLCQRIEVQPNTCYRFTCEIAAKGVVGGQGAALSVLDTFSNSSSLYDNEAFERVVLTGVTGSEQTELVLALRLGGYGALSAGTASFQNVTMERLASAPIGALSFEAIGDQTASAGKEQGDQDYWALIGIVTAACALLGLLFYSRCVNRPVVGAALQKARAPEAFVLLFTGAFLLRLVLSVVLVGHQTDIGCFMGWADAMAEYGPGGFYTSGMFADYPPGYMYVLWAIGGLQRLFDLPYNSPVFVLLLKLPSICADMLTAYLVYKVLIKEHVPEKRAWAVFAAVLFHPLFAFISGGWGQIDSLLSLCMAGVVYLFAREKRIGAGALYGLAILVKPQALMLGPLLAAAYLLPQKGEAYSRRLKQAVLAVLCALAVIIVLALPFSGGQEADWLLNKYFSTASSYPFASVEAFNMAALFGGNWVSVDSVPFLFSYGTWGMLGIVLSVAASIGLYLRLRKRDLLRALFLAAAFLFAGLFTLGHYMHERYLYPGLVCLLFAAAMYNDRRLYLCFLWLSCTSFLNALCAMYIVSNQSMRGATYDSIVFLGSLLTVLGFVYLCYTCYDIAWKRTVLPTLMKTQSADQALAGDREVKQRPIIDWKAKYDNKLHFSKKDWVCLLAVTCVYAAVALCNLGSMLAPETEYTSSAEEEQVQLIFAQKTSISQVWIFGGIAEGTMAIRADSGDTAHYVQRFDEMFRWDVFDVGLPVTRTLTLINQGGSLRIREMAFFDDAGQRVVPSVLGSGGACLDEQHTVPDMPSYLNGMYFDELYHARTAYEHLKGIDPYENSHPPLGKVFIMAGIALFGMNPFGWRITGTLFGIAMLPVFYVFAKRMFKKPAYALLCTALFAFDFMHFTQTRIATIDVYAVFFILLMYYYMYQYYCMNFFVDGLRATLRPLGLAGLFFALGAATKWICIYAGLGLAVLLFLSLFKRYREYKAILREGSEEEKARVARYGVYVVQTLGWCCVFYIAVPVSVYVASYTPYFLCEARYGLADVWNYQDFMWSYHSKLEATHAYQSAWWEWPFTLKPMWYFFNEYTPQGRISTLTASGNPAVWWVCTLGAIWFAVDRVRRFFRGERQAFPAAAVILVGICANYLPWVLVSRCTFIYHFFATVPFIILASVYMLARYEEKHTHLSFVKWAWLGLALLFFALLYPGLSGLEISRTYAYFLKMLPGGWLMYGA